MAVEFTGDFGRRVLRKLRQEQIIWMTTVDADGRPQPRPVWFHWSGKDILIFSPPKAAKVRQIAKNPHTSLHFNADKAGTDVVVLLGEARRAGRVPSARRAAYLRKYRRNMKEPASFQALFSEPIVFRARALRGH